MSSKNKVPRSEPSANDGPSNCLTRPALESMLNDECARKHLFEKRVVRWDLASAMDACQDFPKRMRLAQAQQLEGSIKLVNFSDYAQLEPAAATFLVQLSAGPGVLYKAMHDRGVDIEAVLIGRPCRLDLSGLQSVDEDIARILSGWNGDLILNGLVDLSVASAKELVKSPYELELNGLRSLSAEMAGIVRLQKGSKIQLNGLSTLTLEAAAVLTKRRRFLSSKALSMDGLKSISDDVAKCLAKTIVWSFSLKGLAELSDAAADELIALEDIQVSESLKKSLQAAQRRWRKR